MKTYLVTGGAGFIGCNFVKHLLREYGDDCQIVILDALTYAGNMSSLSDEIRRDNVTFVRGDIGDMQLVESLFRENDIDYVVNFAAESHVDRSITGPRVFVKTNVLGTQNLLETARRSWRSADGGYRPTCRFLQVSTDEVYGSLTKDYDEARPLVLDDALQALTRSRGEMKTYGDKYFTEETPVAPRSPYSASKTAADLLVLAYHETYGLPVNVTRCSNNYGPYHFPEKLIPLIINNILEGKKLPVYGRGANVRDWLYVEDHCRAIDAVLRRGRVGEVYNVGGFNEESNINIVRLVIDTVARLVGDEPDRYGAVVECDPSLINYDLIEYVTDRPGHDMRYAIDPTKIVRELGWYPATSFTEGIEKTVRWNLEHRDWVKAVTGGTYREYYDRQYGNR